jgi:hypothetical protein
MPPKRKGKRRVPAGRVKPGLAPSAPRGKRIPPPVSWDREWFAYLLAAWALVITGLFSLPNYGQLLPGDHSSGHFPLDGFPTLWILVGGFTALVALWRMVPATEENGEDISPWTARICFWVFMALGAFLRLNHPEQPVNQFWEDHYDVINDMRGILDFHERPLLFSFGWREPLFPYLGAFLWLLLPHATGIFIDRLASSLVDLAALWVYYLLGKEIGGRRMGIVLLAMGALSKQMIMVNKYGYGCDTTILSCALASLFFLRLLKKPDMAHFLQWGAALGFGAFTYVPFRVWTPVMLAGVWLWVFSDPRERAWNPSRVILGWGLPAVWAFLFLYKNALLPADNKIIQFLVGAPSLALVAFLLAAGYGTLYLRERKAGFSGLFGWASGAFVAALLTAPFYLHPHYSDHVSSIYSIFKHNLENTASTGTLSRVFHHFLQAHIWMFGREGDIGPIPSLGDSLFDFYVPACGLLGLAYFIARPSWLKAFILCLYLVGFLPYVITPDNNSFRLMAVVVPLSLTAAWGLSRLWLALYQAGAGRAGRLAFTAFLVFFCGCEWAQNTRLLDIWLSQKRPDSLIGDEADKEWPAHRIYLRQYQESFYNRCQDMLAEGKEVFKMNDSNPIDLLPGEKGKDLAVLVSGADLETQKRLKKEFPSASWSERRLFSQSPAEAPFLKCLEVPFDRVEEGKGGFFQVRRLSPWTWRRRCYGHYGLGRGLILYEDRVAHWNDSPPAGLMEWSNSMRLEGRWGLAAAGEYELSVHTSNIFRFFIDGRKILGVEANEEAGDKTAKLFLTAGEHRIEVLTAFISEHHVPAVLVKGPDLSTAVEADQLAGGSVSR